MKKYISRLLLVLSIFTFANLQFAYAETYPELCEVFNRTLKYGDQGVDVKRLQVVMGQEGIAYLSSTGYYGNGTVSAVKTFQTRNGIYPVGKVGPQTLRFMRNLWCFGEAPNNTNPNNTYIPINTNNPELPASGWSNGGSNWNNSGTPEISLQPVSSSANNVTISWNTRAMNSCSIQQDGTSFQNLQSSTGQQIFTLFGEARFTLKCMGFNGREYSKTILVKPNQAISSLPTVNVSINPSQIIVGQQATLYWTSNNTAYCTSNVPGNTSNLQSSGSIPVTISANSQSFTFTCYSTTGQSVSQTITANNTQVTIPVINNFTYSNNLLAWGTLNANSCMLSGGNLNNLTVPNNGNYSVALPTVSITWTLTCYGNTNQSVTRQTNYSIYTTCQQTNTCTTNNGNITANITSNLTNVTSGQAVTLSWTSANATYCNLYGGTSPLMNQLANGSTTVYPNVNSNYYVTCFNASGQSMQSGMVYVTINGTTTNTGTLSVTANPSTVNAGQATTLSWSSPQLSSVSYACTLTGGGLNLSNQSPSGSYVVYPTTTTTYFINCIGSTAGGANLFTSNSSGSVTVTVNGVTGGNITANIYANPTNTTYANQPVTLTWNSTNATYCNVYTGNTNLNNQPINGSTTVDPTVNTNYYVTCFNGSGQSVQSNMAYVTVNNGTSGGNVSVNMSASPNPVAVNQLANLTWYSSNATYCNITGGNTNLTNQPANGSYAVSLAQSTNYTITCYNQNGQNAAAYAYVTVNGGNNGNNVTTLSILSNQSRTVNVQAYKAPYNSCTNGYMIWGDNTSSANYYYPTVYYGSACQINVTHTYNNAGTYTIQAYENNVMVASTQVTVQ